MRCCTYGTPSSSDQCCSPFDADSPARRHHSDIAKAKDYQMLTVHHLNNSRSQRILWLLEELGLEYEIRKYQRDSESNLAPPELRAVHPLGKSPMLTDGERTVIESGAIIDYIVRRHGEGRLAPAPESDNYEDYLQWLHYAEGSAMLPLMLKLYTSRLGDAAAALTPRIHGELDTHLGFMDQALAGKEWFVGDEFSAADIQLSFVPQVAQMLYTLDSFPALAAFLERIHQRPAYRIALDRGGRYDFGG
jgi:glutathione S-transferase